MQTDSTRFGLSPKVQIEVRGDNQIAIRKVIKSRIVRKDAAKIVEIAARIKSVSPDSEVSLVCTRNICSKSIALLEQADIRIDFENI